MLAARNPFLLANVSEETKFSVASETTPAEYCLSLAMSLAWVVPHRSTGDSMASTANELVRRTFD